MRPGITYRKIKGDPEPHCNCKKCNYYKKCRIVLAVALAVVSSGLIAVIVLAEVLMNHSTLIGPLHAPIHEILGWSSHPFSPLSGPPLVPSLGPPSVPCCPEGGSDTEGNATISQRKKRTGILASTSALPSMLPLAVIDTQQEKDFMMRYANLVEHWIGLRRDSGQPWKWVNGTIFSQQLFEIRAGGDCAYLSDVFVSSSRCYSLRNWICSKPDGSTKGKEHAVERD